MHGEASAIRAAIGAGDYQEALRLWHGYAAQLRRELACGAAGDTAVAQAGELVVWSRTALLCARSHMLDRLNSAYVASIYARPDAGGPESPSGR